MEDVYRAMQRLGAELSQRVARLSGARGLAHKPYAWMYRTPSGGGLILVTSTTVSFPYGHHASFTPRADPELDSWFIDVRRTDGEERPDWQGPLRVGVYGSGYALLRRGNPFTDDALAAMLYALSAP